MPYSLRVVYNREYVEIGINGFKEAQEKVLRESNLRGRDIVVINDDDNCILCTAVFHSGEASLSLCTTGGIDDPTR